MAKKSDDVGQSEVQQKRDDDAERGFRGTTPGSIPDKAYSLQTGPDSPGPLEANAEGLRGRADQLSAIEKKGA